MTWSEMLKNGFPENTTAVVNVAGQNILDPTRRWTEGFKQNVWASRVNTTKYMAQVIQESDIKPSCFVVSSGVGFYPPSNTEEYSEDGPGGDFDFLSRLCKDWEEAAQLPDELNVRTVQLRTGVVLGREGGMIQQLIVPFFLGLGGPVGSGSQPMPWIHIRDIVGLYMHAIENGSVSGAMNGVAPDLITNKQFAQAFGGALWRPSFIPLPSFVVNGLFGSDRAKVMTEGQKVLPTKALETGYEFKYPDIKLAAGEFSKIIYADEFK